MWEIIGHERIVAQFEQEIGAGTLSHALLLTGPAGVGKTHLARELAKTLNCTGTEPPCQRCRHCHQIQDGWHPDVALVERAEGKDSILIQQVRELRDSAVLRPFQGRAKVYIIAGAEALTPPAADALLKVLEEPQPAVTLVLTAIAVDALPLTIVSRCRIVPLRPVPASRLAPALRERGTPADAESIARLAQGSVGWALRAAQQPKLVTQQADLVRRLSVVLDLDLDARLQLAEQLVAERKDRSTLRRALELLALLARDLLLLSQSRPPRLAEGEQRETLARQAARLSLESVESYLRAVRLAMERIDQNVDARLTLEALLVSLP